MDREGYLWDNISNSIVSNGVENVVTTFRLPTGVVIRGQSKEEAQDKLKIYLKNNRVPSKHLTEIEGFLR